LVATFYVLGSQLFLLSQYPSSPDSEHWLVILWSFHYLWKNPVLIQCSLAGCSTCYHPTDWSLVSNFTTSHPSAFFDTDWYLWSLCWPACTAI